MFNPNDDESVITSIDACYLSPLKFLCFLVLALTVIPVLFIKWYDKVRRVLLYSYTTIENATHVVVCGSRKSDLRASVDGSYEIVPLSKVKLQDRESHEERSVLVGLESNEN